MTGGIRPYSVEISSKSDIAIIGNQGGGQGDTDLISVVDMKVQPPRVIENISVGQTPEGVAMSPKGDFVAVTVMNGSNKPKSSPFYNDSGLLKIFAVQGTRLSLVAEALVGHWCQGAAWSRDQKTILVQCMVERELQVFRFTGDSLCRTGEVKLKAGRRGSGRRIIKPPSFVMAGLVPAIHVLAMRQKGVDARHKAGHDVKNSRHCCTLGAGLNPSHERARHAQACDRAA